MGRETSGGWEPRDLTLLAMDDVESPSGDAPSAGSTGQPSEARAPRAMRALTAAGYGVALSMVVIPLGDTLVNLLPARLYEPQWRFGAVGMASSGLLTPLFGLALATYVALAARHRRTLRVLSLLAGTGFLLLLLAAANFVLDAFQTRPNVVPEARARFYAASAQALAKMGLIGCVTLLLAIGAWRADRAVKVASRLERRDIVFPIFARD